VRGAGECEGAILFAGDGRIRRKKEQKYKTRGGEGEVDVGGRGSQELSQSLSEEFRF